MTIISKIPKVVSDRNMSLAELSRQTGLSFRTIIKLYYADFTSLHIEVLDRLCATLCVAPGDLLTFVPASTPGLLSKYPTLEDYPNSPTRSKPHSRNKRVKQAKVLSKVLSEAPSKAPSKTISRKETEQCQRGAVLPAKN